MNNSYTKLAIVALLPVFAAVVLYLLDRKTPFGKVNKWLRSLLYGLIFGGLAVLGTEWGIPMNGAQVNCRDAAVLAAGLFFGAPAGIIAGIIGGVERWIAVAWGVGTFTRVACSVSTVIAGFYAAALRKFMFEDKKPGWFISLAIGVVMEVFHLTMVFITNMAMPTKAMAVVQACSIPMIAANGISVMLTALALTLIAREKAEHLGSSARISQTIQRWLLLTVLLAFVVTSFFVFRLQSTIADSQVNSQLKMSLDEIETETLETSDQHIIALAQEIAEQYPEKSVAELVEEYGISELNIVDADGIIIESSYPDFIGYDMASGSQSAQFLVLNKGRSTFVQKYGPISYDTSISRKYAGAKLEDGGFVQVGFDAAAFQRNLGQQASGITSNRHVGSTGFSIIASGEYKIVSAPAGAPLSTLAQQCEVMLAVPENTTTVVHFNNEPYFCQYREVEGYYLISVIPQDEALEMRNLALYVNSFMEILVFAVLFGLIYLLIKRVVVNQIKNINRSLAQITGGNLDVVVDVRSNEEFASLSDDINSTVSTLKHYIAEASARIDAELEFAKNIQSSALPNKFPAFPKRRDVDIFATMHTAKEVGGDFYDFYMTGTDDLHFLIADVSGKGIPAAMFMMRAKTELKSLTEADMPINDVFTHGNAALCEGNDAGMFVTAWQGGIDLTTGLVQYANAGHNPPLVRHGDGKFDYVRSRAGFVLAGMDGVRYKTQELQLAPGDIIFLYTDGVTEATDANEKLYGEDRLLEAINAKEFASMEELCRYVKQDVDAFVGDAPQFDDITMVALKYIGTPPDPEIHFDAATTDDITAVTAFVEEQLEKMDCPMKTVFQINVAIDEIFSNIVRYGYPGGAGPVTVQVAERIDPHRVRIRFSDEGVPYNPLNNSDPDVTLSAEERGIGGLGIYMVRKTMDNVKYVYEDGKNILTITKKI